MFKHILFLFCIGSRSLFSQESYFQQELRYKMKVELDDHTHSLHGYIEIHYKNNSPHVLDKIGFHLWPNAYKHKQTAFAKQKIRMGDLNFHNAPEEALGSIGNIDFKVNGIKAEFQYHPKHGDMGWLILNQALMPQQEIIISSPFRVQIPENFSRMGRGLNSYQITQWYPKPAVYDHKGWHLMPYLDYGEFYSEFGSFEVEISLPEDYVVAATGTLMTPEEHLFLDQKIQWTNDVLAQNSDESSVKKELKSGMKTLRYVADRVHDFAWFADKNFLVQKSRVALGNEKSVDTWVFFKSKETWKNATLYLNRSVGYFSSLIGDYPWPQVTAVESELNAGGGMEYPMITVIGSMPNTTLLDETIAHEVAHNWFYGILAFNERDHPFMDEGITSYYEQRYMQHYYKDADWMPTDGWFSRIFRNVDPEKFQYLLFARNYQDQLSNQNSDLFTAINYGLDVYEKPAKLFAYTASWIGRGKMDSLFCSFYEKWKFKHPYPEDLENHFKENSPKNFDWLFKEFLSSHGKMDYRMKAIRNANDSMRIIIQNCGRVQAPFILSGIRNDEPVESQWVDGFKGVKSVSSACTDCDYFAIDIDQESFDLYENNNYIKSKGSFKKTEKWHIRMLPLLDKPRTTDIGLTPVLNANYYDGISPGLFISGPLLPFRNFKMHLMPFYGFRSKEVSGSAGINYHLFFPDTKIHHLQFELDLKKYAYAKSKPESFLNYVQLKPSITLALNHPSSHQMQSHVRYTLFAERNAYLDFSDTLSPGYSKKHLNTFTHALDYSRSKESILGHFSVDIRLLYFNQNLISPLRQEYLRADITLEKSFLIAARRYANIRSYVSFFPIHTERNSTTISSRSSPFFYRGSTGLTFQNYQDELNEHYFLGRTEQGGIASQQIDIRQGGFKLPLGSAYREQIGNSNSFVAALNVSTELPLRKLGSLFRPYFDLGYYHSRPDSPEGNWLWSSGIQLQLIPERFSIFFPVAHSGNIRDILRAQSGKNYLKQISFSLNIAFTEADVLKKLFNF